MTSVLWVLTFSVERRLTAGVLAKAQGQVCINAQSATVISINEELSTNLYFNKYCEF